MQRPGGGGEVAGLGAARQFAAGMSAAYAGQSDHTGQFVASLRHQGVDGAVVHAAEAAQQASDAAATAWARADQALTGHEQVREAYAANPGAGSKGFITDDQAPAEAPSAAAGGGAAPGQPAAVSAGDDGTDAVNVETPVSDLEQQRAEAGCYWPGPDGAESGPYVDWSPRNDDGTRHVELSSGENAAVGIDMTPGDLLELHAALASTLARADTGAGDDESAEGADVFYPSTDHRARVEWTEQLPDGRRRVEAGRGDETVVLELDREQLQQWHDALGQRIAADRAAAADPDDPRERAGQEVLFAASSRLPDKPADEQYDTTSKLVLDDDPGWGERTTEAVERALRFYRCSTFRWVNRYLRGADDAETSRLMREAPGAEPTYEDVNMHVALIDTAMEASPLHVPVQVWRGWNDTPKALGPLWRDGADMTGVEWTEPRYQSTSADPNVALMFADDVIMRLHVPPGVGAIQLSSWVTTRHHTREAELLLDRELRMRVVADQVQEIPSRSAGGQPYTTRVLDVEVLPPLPEEDEGQPSPPAAAGAAT
ncbi:ADP-ribosyltransferase [Dactylosporangium sucinum]|uniref:ADP ribosyltransferase domain-containing protein n=1 Tax=Dactylosporangium sucinum TaxID=1424081 RepID=A0A917WRN0_9ACTN|nr:ADP-ribosyltransferase [Dactylosporangium sucinum]GGM23128.1 hypothetical protein GCM10007977_025430 [Dactylosporangium sucinum]